jgi:hypothetical protein
VADTGIRECFSIDVCIRVIFKMKFKNSIEIDRSLEDVFGYVSNITNGSAWDSAVLKITKLSEGDVRKGATYRMIRKLPGGEAENILEVVELIPNHELALKTTSGPTPFLYRYSFEPIRSGTRIVLESELLSQHLGSDVGGVASILPDSILEPFVKRGVLSNLHTLKSILESSSVPLTATGRSQ